MRYASKQISQANRNRPIKKTVTKKSFAGVSVNQRDKNGLNVLAKAAELVINKQLVNAASNRNISEVENLLARGADVNAKDRYGSTALHWAAIRGPLEFVKLLLDRGADVNVTNKYGETALHVAVFWCFTDIVKALVIAGADVNATNKYGLTVLELAKNNDCYDDVKKAIKEGKQKLISLYENQQCQLKTVVNSPIYLQLEDLEEPLLQNAPEKLNETQIQQAIKYIKEQSFRTKFKIFGNINSYNDIKKYFWK